MSEGLPYADMGRGIHRSPWNCTDSSRTQTTNQRIKVSKNYELKESFLPIEKNLFWSQKCGSTKFAWSCSLWRNEDIQQVSEFMTKKRLFESVANKEKSDKNFWKRKPVLKAQCEKTRNSLPRKFFSSNWFTVKFFSKTLIWRNFCERTVAVKSRNFHSTVWKFRKITPTPIFPSNHFCKFFA